ncbi:MAG: HIT family protein [Candidatus Micrarchaeota archaeon]|nr:HIT family protein [Candidatus Micrarchaeota archaeon]
MALDENCLFCKIIKKEIPAEIVYEDSMTLVFLDINPRNPGHLLVIPKNHYGDMFDIPDGELRELIVTVKKMARAAKEGMKADGISVSQSNGQAAGQVISHMHFHVIPRFLSEGPQGLEAILPTKKMTNEMLAEIKKAIMDSIQSMGGRSTTGEDVNMSFSTEKKEEDPFGF